jgi:4-hydroxy-tetrahydrodipicolinate synthase
MKLAGCLIAIPTPFSELGVDHAVLAQHASWAVDHGVRGIVVCGTTGEAATMTHDERVLAMRVVKESVGDRVPVLGGVGSNSTAETIDAVRRVTREVALDGVMCVVPYYNKPPQRGMVSHFTAIADASPVPVLVYNVPSRTAISLSLDSMLRLAEHPNVLGFKEASGDLIVDALLCDGAGSRSLLSGDDSTAMAFMALGGHGVISVVGNVAPSWVAELCAATTRGDLETARRVNARVVRLHQLMFAQPSPAPAKAALEWLGFGPQRLRLPMMPLEPGEKATLFGELERLEVPR